MQILLFCAGVFALSQPLADRRRACVMIHQLIRENDDGDDEGDGGDDSGDGVDHAGDDCSDRGW